MVLEHPSESILNHFLARLKTHKGNHYSLVSSNPQPQILMNLLIGRVLCIPGWLELPVLYVSLSQVPGQIDYGVPPHPNPSILLCAQLSNPTKLPLLVSSMPSSPSLLTPSVLLLQVKGDGYFLTHGLAIHTSNKNYTREHAPGSSCSYFPG